MIIKDIEINVKKVHELFFERYSDRDLFTRLKWITDNIYDIYFYKYKKPETVVKLKELIFSKLYGSIEDKNCVKAYMQFLESKGLTLELVGNKVKNEDAYAILFFKLFVYGLDKYTNIKHLVIDEMQDYTPLQMYILQCLFDCPKTILGDYNQSVNPKIAKRSFEQLINVLSGDNEIVTLNKSYRSTMEIAHFFNSINSNVSADVVSRSGEKVDFVLSKKQQYVKTLLNLVENYKKLGYTSIGIVTKTNDIAKKIHSDIVHYSSDISLIDDNIT